MDSEKKAVFMTLVTGRKQKDAILSALVEANVNLINIVYGKGAVKDGFLQNLLGLYPEENKVVLLCATTRGKADNVFKLLVDRFNFNKPNTGMAFTIPIECVSY